MAERLGVSEEEVLEVIRRLKEEGKLARIGAVLYHRRSGYKYNAMVCANVDQKAMDEVAEKIAENPMVTHCYQRIPAPDWDYNLYFMYHGRDKEEVEKGIKNLLDKIPYVKRYIILFSEREFKKTSVEYV